MKAHVWFTLFMLAAASAGAQELNKKSMDTRFGRELLMGYCDRQGLEADEDFAESFDFYYAEYTPDPSVVDKIRRQVKKLSIVVILGTWCGDSQEQVPAFYKVLDEAGFKGKHLQVVCVDGQKKSPGIDITRYAVEFVPTIIFYRKGKELGRIVESPEYSLEEDMLNIIQ